MTKIDICEFRCWCEFCRIGIEKGEHYLDLRKKARKGETRVNICARCLTEFAKQIPKQDIKAVENRLALKELEKI